jgi:hypothetical protein
VAVVMPPGTLIPGDIGVGLWGRSHVSSRMNRNNSPFVAYIKS